MSHAYIAYKRADVARVAQLAEALEAAGIPVWFDQELPGNESWRSNLEKQHSSAGCVLVVWSVASTGPDNRWVLEEANPALEDSRLVQVTLENVKPPFGFRETQSLDLSHWRGNSRDLALRDVIEAIDAKLKGELAPVPQWPRQRVKRIVARYGLGSAAAAAIISLTFNTFGAATRVCTLPAFQPGLSDMCGSVGLGGRPSHEERLAWEQRAPHSCEALRRHIQNFAAGAYAQQANNLLTARKVRQDITWAASVRALPFTQLMSSAPSAGLDAARASSLAQAKGRMADICKGFAAGSGNLFRFIGVGTPKVREWSCQHGSGGIRCGWSGNAMCQLEESTIGEMESC